MHVNVGTMLTLWRSYHLQYFLYEIANLCGSLMMVLGLVLSAMAPTLRAYNSGDYTVTARIPSNSNSCFATNFCQTSNPFTVTITQPAVSICGTLTGCFNPESTTQQPLHLCAVPDTFSSYAWTINGSPLSDTSSSISITPQAPGSFQVVYSPLTQLAA